MILLLDAHTLLWWLFDDPSLRATARAAIANPGTDVLISASTIWQVAIPIHFGFAGRTGKGTGRGPMANLLTPSVVDPNSHTPEYKTFLVKLEKIGGPV